MSVNKGQIIKM